MEWFDSVDPVVAWEVARPWFEQYGFLAAFAFAFLESCVLTGYFFPGGNLLIALGFFARGNPEQLPALIVAAALGSVLGDLFDFALGWRSGRSLDRFPRFQNIRALVLGLLERYGPAIIIGAKFVQALRSGVAIGAGAAGISLRVFVLYASIGSLLWTASAIGVGFLGAELIIAAWESPHRGLLITIAFLAGIASWVVVAWFGARLTTGLAKESAATAVDHRNCDAEAP
ncbi:MAG: VTT domain-containing protein [Chloroflexi bacterium]|nr:VTT domain-containing protein [Chloroflexota bacterium]